MKRFAFIASILAIPVSIFGFKKKKSEDERKFLFEGDSIPVPESWMIQRDGRNLTVFKNGKFLKQVRDTAPTSLEISARNINGRPVVDM